MSEPSVDQLLRAAERDAVALLNQASVSDAIDLAAGWHDVLDGASQVLAAIPAPLVRDDPPTADRQYLAARVAAMAAHTRCVRPLKGTPHPGMVSLGTTFRHAATLLRRHAREGRSRTGAGPADLEAATLRIARTIATAAHAVSRELQDLARAAHAANRATNGGTAPRTVSLPDVTTWVELTQGQEQVALDYVTHRKGRQNAAVLTR